MLTDSATSTILGTGFYAMLFLCQLAPYCRSFKIFFTKKILHILRSLTWFSILFFIASISKYGIIENESQGEFSLRRLRRGNITALI